MYLHAAEPAAGLLVVPAVVAGQGAEAVHGDVQEEEQRVVGRHGATELACQSEKGRRRPREVAHLQPPRAAAAGRASR